MSKRRINSETSAVLAVRNLHVFYGASHALQGVDLTLTSGLHAVVGRNGMGKTTLCNAIMGLLPIQSGSIRIDGQEVSGRKPNEIAKLGVGYTPQGRRLWPTLSVDEHLHMCEIQNAAWTVERIYETFPRLAERRSNGGAQLSGGEQQMLAIGRSLLQDPHLLILDEPTEGLAPVIVSQVEELLYKLTHSEGVSILLVEQNIGVATSIADDVAIMANGQISTIMDAKTLGNDRLLQQQLLGVGRLDEYTEPSLAEANNKPYTDTAEPENTPVDLDEQYVPPAPAIGKNSGYIPPTRWTKAAWNDQHISAVPEVKPVSYTKPSNSIKPLFRESTRNHVLVAGTFDTKNEELEFITQRLRTRGVNVSTVDLSTSGHPSSATVPPHIIAACHPGGSNAVFTNDRGRSISAMAKAFELWIEAHSDIAGIISAGGSGGTALATPAMQTLSVGVPKVMISTVASGNVGPYVGPTDIMMMYSVTDIQGINPISQLVLGNGADALAGMLKDSAAEPVAFEKPAIGLTMFGVTTPAVQQLTSTLKDNYECLVFHATGVGGQSLEKLADSGLLSAAIDLTTTEVCDYLFGGVFPATDDRFGAFARTRIPYVGSVGALDMVNFAARNTVPEKFEHRKFVEHNAQVTLMRTNVEENVRMGKWIGEKINAMEGPVRFLIPQAGISALDAPDQPFYDPEANAALFSALKQTIVASANRRIIEHPGHINDASFIHAVIDAFNEIKPFTEKNKHAAH